MFTPMRNLGANLLFVFSVGGVWAVGYLVSPFLQPILPPEDIIVLRKSMMLLAVLGFSINTFARAYELNWIFIRDLRFQIGLAATLTGIAFILVPAEDAGLSSVLYGITSLVCVAWVAWSRHIEQSDAF